MNRGLKLCALAALSLLALAGCSSSRGGLKICPRVVVLGEAADVTIFAPGGEDEANISYRGRVNNTYSECDIDEGIAESDITLTFAATRGPKAPAGGFTVTLPYFVTTTEVDAVVLSRQTGTVTLDFDADSGSAVAEIDIDGIAIPIAEGHKTINYEIVVGLSLTPEQLAYNRRRFR